MVYTERVIRLMGKNSWSLGKALELDMIYHGVDVFDLHEMMDYLERETQRDMSMVEFFMCVLRGDGPDYALGMNLGD